MNSPSGSSRSFVRSGAFLIAICLATATPTLAQNLTTVQDLRTQYNLLMSDLERYLASQGDTAGQDNARRGREALKGLSDQQLTALYSHTRVPDLSVATTASRFLVSRMNARQKAAAAGKVGLLSAGFPDPVAIPAGCDGVDITAETRYALLIVKEVTNSILAAAAWVCNEDILGENGSVACIPLAIAADVANGFFDTATFCAGEVTANQVDANFNRLSHIHDDLANGITAIVSNDNANASTIIGNDNANAANIINTAAVNTLNIINNDNANLLTIVNNAAANKTELRDLILRTQIEADLAQADSAVVVALFELPTANGGHLDLVASIVAETIAKIQAAGGTVGTAPSFLSSANAAKTAGNFKTAYALYRRAYKAAGK